jgi:hypothetical protein
MNSPMNVGIVLLVIVCQGIDDHLRLLAGRGVVEVYKRMAIDFRPEDREILPDPRNIE